MIKIEFNSEMEKEVAPIPVTQSNNNLQNLPEDSFLFYNNSNITILNLDKSLLIKFLPKILSQQTLSKYFSHEDFLKLKSFWSNHTSHCKTKDHFKDFFSDISKNKDAIHLFQSLLKNNYFSYNYQKNLEKYQIQSLSDLISIKKQIYAKLKSNYSNYLQNLLNQDLEFSDEHELLNQKCSKNKVYLEPNYQLASSGYTSLYSDEEKDEIESQNLSSKQLNFQKEDKNNYENILSPERFKNMKINKNQLTIRTRTKEDIKEYQRQELERYKNPHLPWEYVNPDKSKSIVAPVLKKMPSSLSSKPREHAMLKQDRPSYVTILCLARDAAAKLPDGVGTRADICDLLKDSQYINERLSDSQINNIVSGALDRLHYEKDPCVKYDLQRKLWIYLHKNRTIDYAPWNEHLKKNETEKSDKKEGKNSSLNIIISKRDDYGDSSDIKGNDLLDDSCNNTINDNQSSNNLVIPYDSNQSSIQLKLENNKVKLLKHKRKSENNIS